MPDVLQVIANEAVLDKDPRGNLIGLEDWSPQMAEKIASGLGIRLTPAHMAVVQFLRDQFRDNGPAASGRLVLTALQERFAKEGGGRYLYRLFPGGPVSQGSRIAGLPEPPGSHNDSFGYRQ
jgi:tRNA 2-thiouridine synthesizing protein E